MKNKPLNEQLLDEAYRFEFFQAVRLLERIYPEKSPVGQEVTPQNEVVRFKSHLSLNFPPSPIHLIKEVDDEFNEQRHFEMFINFMGMIVAANMIGQICFLKTTSSMTIKGTRSFTIRVRVGAAT